MLDLASRLLDFNKGIDLYRTAFLTKKHGVFHDTLEAYLGAIAVDSTTALMEVLFAIRQNMESEGYSERDNFLKRYPILPLAVSLKSSEILQWAVTAGWSIALDLFKKNPVLIENTISILARANPRFCAEFIERIYRSGIRVDIQTGIRETFDEFLTEPNPDYEKMRILSELLHKMFYTSFLQRLKMILGSAVLSPPIRERLTQELLAAKSIFDAYMIYIRLFYLERGVEYTNGKGVQYVCEETPVRFVKRKTEQEVNHKGFIARWLAGGERDSPLLKNPISIWEATHVWMSGYAATHLVEQWAIDEETWRRINNLLQDMIHAEKNRLRDPQTYFDVIQTFALLIRDIESRININLNLDSPAINEDTYLTIQGYVPHEGESPFQGGMAIQFSEMVNYTRQSYRICKYYMTGVLDPVETVYDFEDLELRPLFTNSRHELACYPDVMIDPEGNPTEALLNAYMFYSSSTLTQEEVIKYYERTGIALPCIFEPSFKEKKRLPLSFLEKLREQDFLSREREVTIHSFKFTRPMAGESSQRLHCLLLLLNNYHYADFNAQEIAEIEDLFGRYSLNSITEMYWKLLQKADFMFDIKSYALLGKVHREVLFKLAKRLGGGTDKYEKMVAYYNFWQIMRETNTNIGQWSARNQSLRLPVTDEE